MSYRKSYISVPIDYVRELKMNGNRKKARSFLEYFDDMDLAEHNSVRFYAKSWDVSVGTAHKWIDDFNREIDKYYNFWKLKNARHYSSVKKQTEHQLNEMNTDEARNNGEFQKRDEQQLNKVFNINTTTKGDPGVSPHLDTDFMRLITELKLGYKNIGNLEDSYKAYSNIKEKFNSKDILKAYKSYAFEVDQSKRVGLAKFLNQLIYMSYVKAEIKITNNNEIYSGFYDSDKELLVSGDKTYKFSQKKYDELNNLGNIKIIRFVA
jgi:uncharacterized protein YukE